MAKNKHKSVKRNYAKSKNKSNTPERFFSGWKPAPLSGLFMVVSLLGLLSTVYLIKTISWKWTLFIIFAIMFVASIISMTKAPIKEETRY